MEGIFALYTELLITGEAQIEAGWSLFRDTVLGETFSKDTLFQLCNFMVDAPLRLSLQVLVVMSLLTCYVTLTRSFKLSGPQFTFLKNGDNNTCPTISNNNVPEPCEDGIMHVEVLRRTGNTMCK